MIREGRGKEEEAALQTAACLWKQAAFLSAALQTFEKIRVCKFWMQTAGVVLSISIQGSVWNTSAKLYLFGEKMTQKTVC